MLTRQVHFNLQDTPDFAALAEIEPQLILAFGDVAFFSDSDFPEALASAFPSSIRIGCSTAGEITSSGVFDRSCVVTAVRFQHTTLRLAHTRLETMADSRLAGERLAEQLGGQTLPRAVMLFGQGVGINGSALVAGLNETLGQVTQVTGGLAGDGGAFQKTWVLGPEGAAADLLTAVGLYGDQLTFSHGCFGGWEPFGPARKVTRCVENVLFELDGERALDIYKRYLGEHARELPGSGLLFPFSIVSHELQGAGLIRTILGVDEEAGSLTLAGEVQLGSTLKLMHASPDMLVSGAERAATAAKDMFGGGLSGLVILVSCVCRKMVMGTIVDEEVEAVADIFGPGNVITGFYSYGEFCPMGRDQSCQLHNQTMTITFLAER